MKSSRSLIKPLIAGNWKMNGGQEGLVQVKSLVRHLDKKKYTADIIICPPEVYIFQAVQISKGSKLLIGGQNCHAQQKGAHTGDTSAGMLNACGAKFVIVGHSERRQNHHETDTMVCAKAQAAHEAGLVPIICLGETLKERESGNTLRVVGIQLRKVLAKNFAHNIVIAYEPVWAIGTGLTPTLEQVAGVHAHIRKALMRHFGDAGTGIRILYGGSVNPRNAKELLAIENVNGALVGGASLRAADFIKIMASL